MIHRKLYSILLFSLLIPFYLSSCVPSTKQCGCSEIKPIVAQSKIVGGYVARNNSWPWIVSLRRIKKTDNTSRSPGSSFCVGSLINSKYILTAAHCFDTVDPSQLSNYFAVVGGVFRNDTNKPRFTIKSVTLHDGFDVETYKNDIALLELWDRVDFDNPKYGSICLPPNSPSTYPDEPLVGTAAGWGLLRTGGSSSYTLQQVELPVITYSNQYCSKVIEDRSIQFCAGYVEGGKDTCQGDSGGPFMILDTNSDTWAVAGVTSYGYGCAVPERPGVYTRVSKYIDWINANMDYKDLESRASMKSVPFIIVLFFIFYMFFFLLFWNI